MALATPPLAGALLGKERMCYSTVWPSKPALCNALEVSDLHWVWAIAATSGPRFRFVRGHGAVARLKFVAQPR